MGSNGSGDPTFEVKGYRELHTGRDGKPWSAAIHVDGKKACIAIEYAGGGEMEIQVTNEAAWAKLDAHAESQPDVDFGGFTLPSTSDIFIEGLVIAFVRRRRLKERCNRRVMVKVPGDDEGYFEYRRPLTHELVAAIRQKYPGCEILNVDRFGQEPN